MSRKRSADPPPPDEEILSYNNVPCALAAKYIGWSDVTIRYALQQERAPFGMATQNPNTATWSYNISPGLLVAYKRGQLQAWRLHDVINLAADGIQKVLDERMDETRRFAEAVFSGNSSEPGKRRGRSIV